MHFHCISSSLYHKLGLLRLISVTPLSFCLTWAEKVVDRWTKTYNSCSCVHKARLSLDKNSPATLLCVVGGATSKSECLKEWTDGRGGGVFTLGEKTSGGLIATEECQNSVLLSLSRLRLSLWVGNICFTSPPHHCQSERGDGQTNDFTE